MIDPNGEPVQTPDAGAPTEPPLSLDFTGTGAEYFRIWIVNLLLMVITLGIYSAWAKVRREKFFHQHTLLAASNFDYHGMPASILRGRLLALMLLGLTQADFLGPIATIGAWVALLALLPWLMQRSLRFRLANTSYRGMRLSFDGTVAQAYRIVGGFALLAAALIAGPALALVGQAGQLVVLMVPLVIVLLYPMLHANWRRYAITHARFGNLRLQCSFRRRDFVAVYFAVVALWFLFSLPAVVAVTAIDRIDLLLARFGIESHAFGHLATFLGGLFVYCMASAVWPYITARVQNLTWSNTRLGEHAIASTLDPLRYVQLQLQNLLLTIVTLGLYRPFAAVATACASRRSACCPAWTSIRPWRRSARAMTSRSGRKPWICWGSTYRSE